MVAEPTSGFGQLDFREDDGRRGGWPCDDGHLELHGKISLISASQGPGARNRAGENKHRDANGSSWFPESSQQEAEASEVPKLERANGEEWKRPWGTDRKMEPENNEGPRLDSCSQE